MLKYVVLASIFWFNPLISNIDILPDVVGYLLIIKAFSRLSYVNSYAEDVLKAARKMCIVTGLKLLSIFLVSSFDPTMSLLLSFCFAIIETVFAIPFFASLFYLFSKITTRENSEYDENRAYRVHRLTVVTFVARLIMAMLPDLTALSLNGALEIENKINYLRFRPLFHGFSVIITLIFSIIWLVAFIKLVASAFTKRVTAECEDLYINQASNKKSLFVAKDNIRVTVLIAIASIFIFDFSWGYTYFDFLQDFALPLIALASFIYLLIKGYFKVNYLFFALVISFGVQFILDFMEIKANVSYFEKYNLDSILKVSEAESMYFNVCLFAIFTSLALIVSSTLVLLLMRKNARDNILKFSALFSESDIDYYLNEFDKRTRKHILMNVSFSAISSTVYVLTVILKPYAEWMVLLCTVAELLFVISFIICCLYLHDEVYKRILIFS